MTPRSKRYFARKQYGPSQLEAFVNLMDNILICMRAIDQLRKPIPRYPSGGNHPGGFAMVGDTSPELLMDSAGRFFPKFGLPTQLPKGTTIIPERDIIEFAGHWDVKIKNPFTPFSEGEYTKIDRL